MTCPHCGDPNAAGATFCPRCRKRVVAPSWSGQAPVERTPAPAPRPASAPAAFVRPRALTLLAVLDVLAGTVLVFLGGLAAFATTLNSGDDRAFLAAMAVFCVPFGIAQLATGVGLLGLRPWSRTAQIVVAGVSMLNIPVGTVVGVLQLAWLVKPGARTLFSGRRPRDLSEEELHEAEIAAAETGLVTGAAVTGLVVVGCAGAGIVAAVALPSLLFARVAANEAAALADVRSVVAAQASYQSANGHYDRIECLNVPSACIPGYSRTEPPFLPGTFVTNQERNGYRFHLEPGPPPANLSIARSSASSIERYAYIAIPTQFRKTGRRVFCGDDTGRVCAFTDLGATRIADHRCSAACVDVIAR
jgi:hypothetical protein